MTTITLDHTFTTGVANALKPQQPVQVPQVPQSQSQMTKRTTTLANRFSSSQQPASLTTEVIPSNQNSPDITDSLNNVNFECGKPDFREPSVTGLVIGGYQAVRGQFPW